jgi:hypothetical protein
VAAMVEKVRVSKNTNTYIVQKQEFQHRSGRGMHAGGRTLEMM